LTTFGSFQTHEQSSSSQFKTLPQARQKAIKASPSQPSEKAGTERQMTHWLIAKTDPAKEFIVAQALEQLGHTAWVPTYIATGYERFTAGPGVSLRRRKPVERPLMPSVLFVAHVDPPSFLPATRHLQGFWTDCFEVARVVPETQLSIFRERVDAVNAAEIARIKKSQLGRRKAKRTVRLGDPSLADQLRTLLFGQEQQEAA
jgi:hypothetical protein